MNIENAIYLAKQHVIDLINKKGDDHEIVIALREILDEINREKNECNRLEFENTIVENRLKHLLGSRTIRMYDDKVKGKYVKDISELDNIFIESAIPQFVIHAEKDKTTLVFEIDAELSSEDVNNISREFEDKTGCRCLIITPDCRLKHAIQERND